MNEIDILGFDPSVLTIYSNSNNSSPDYYERKLNYPYDIDTKKYESSSNAAQDIVAYVLNAMTRNSIEHESLLLNHKYDKKDDYHDKHHASWQRQVLDCKFYANIYGKMEKILKCIDRLKEKANTYTISNQLYNTWKANMVEYVWDKQSNRQHIEWFVDGLMKFIFSAVWDYNSKSWILENPICSFRYEFSTEQWKKIKNN